MLEMRDKGLIISIINYCERIKEKINGVSLDEFKNNNDIREIVCFNMFQIGELAKKLSNDFIKTYNKIPWKYVKGMRDRIVHGYDSIDFEIVWNTSNKDIIELLEYSKQIIE